MITRIDQPDAGTLASLRTFLARHPGAGIELDPAWGGVLRRAMGHRPTHLIATDGPGNVRGYLPLCRVSSRLFGHFLVSLPYLNRAGVVADDDNSTRALIDHAAELADRWGVRYLELRHGEASIDHPRINADRTDKVAMVLDLPGDGDELDKAVGAKVRNQVRKGDKASLTIRWGGAEMVEAFYDVFSTNMRDLGTPVYPRRLFRAVLEAFPDRAEIAVVGHMNRPVAAAMLLHDAASAPTATAGTNPGGTTHVPSASCLRSANPLCANMWLYRALLGRAIARGSTRFDFGRSTVDSGTYRFKKQWGATARSCRWQYVRRRGALDVARPDNPRYRRRIEAWQRLPVWVTRALGPAIVRGIP